MEAAVVAWLARAYVGCTGDAGLRFFAPVVVWAVQLSAYAVFGLFFTLVDVVQPPLLHRWRIQRHVFLPRGQPAVHPSLAATLSRLALAFAVALVVLIALAATTVGIDASRAPSSSVTAWIWHSVASAVGAEVLFYAAHRALHTRWLYRRFHKQHHEFHHTIAIAAMAAHPLEAALTSLSVMLVPHLLHTPLTIVVVASVLGVLSTQWDHCGYWWLGRGHSVQPFFHDFHHERNAGNFGFTGHMDALLGTDTAWRKQREERIKQIRTRAATEGNP